LLRKKNCTFCEKNIRQGNGEETIRSVRDRGSESYYRSPHRGVYLEKKRVSWSRRYLKNCFGCGNILIPTGGVGGGGGELKTILQPKFPWKGTFTEGERSSNSSKNKVSEILYKKEVNEKE